MSAVARKLVAADPPALHEPTRKHPRGSTLFRRSFHARTEVARYRDALPAPHLNTVVMGSFALLYTPLAAHRIVEASATGLLLLQRIVPHSVWVSLPLAALVSLALLVLTRDSLRIEETFPEMLRIPVLGGLLRWTGGIGRA